MALKKRWGQAALAAAAGLGALAWAGGAWHGSKLGSFLLFMVGAGLLAYAFMGCYESPCPECGKALSMDGVHGFARCHHCRAYGRVTDAGLARVEPDAVAGTPQFAIPFKEGLALPDACCVCLKPATRRSALAAEMEDPRPAQSAGEDLKKNALMGAGVRPMIAVRIEVPHCGAHGPDAKIERAEQEIVVLVRSYPYYRAASGLN